MLTRLRLRLHTFLKRFRRGRPSSQPQFTVRAPKNVASREELLIAHGKKKAVLPGKLRKGNAVPFLPCFMEVLAEDRDWLIRRTDEYKRRQVAAQERKQKEIADKEAYERAVELMGGKRV